MPTLQTDTRTATKLPDIFKTINGVNVDIGPLDRLRDGQSPLGPYTSSVAHGRKNQRDSSPERHEAGATSGGGYGTCPRIVLRDGFGRELDTFTTLQAAIYRAKWNVQQTGLARVPLEWRLPKGPLPARPDLSRTCPPPKHPPAHHGGDNTRQQWDGSRVLEFDVEDVCFVQESLQYLPYAPSLSFLRQEILVGPKTYFQIVGTVLLHRKVLSVTEKRKAVHNFPGFCTGCIRMGLCYGCEKSSDIHFHEDKPVKTGGGFTYFKKDRPKHEIQGRHPSNWKIKHPERALKKLMEECSGVQLEGVIPEEVKRELDRQDRSSSQPKLPVSNIPDFAGHAQLHNTQGRDGLLPDIFRKQGITDDLDTEGQHYHGHEGDLDIEGQHYHGHEGDLDLGDVKVVLSEDNSSDSESGAETESDTGGHFEDEGLARGNEQPVGGEAVPRSGLANVNLSIADSGSSRFNRDRRRSSSRSSSKYEHRLPKQRRTSPARDDDAADDGPSRTRHRGEGSDDGEEGGQSYFDDLARGRSRRRGSLYKAPPPFKLKKSPKRRIEAKSPFSSNREYDIPKGDGFQVKKSDKKLTEIKEFSSGEVSWKEPKKFTLKKGESKTTKFWSGPPKQADVIKRRKKRERKPRSKSPRYRKSSSPRPVSPDSGLDSENLTDSTTKSELEPLREETTITVTPEPDMERGPTPLQLRTVTPDRSTESPATGRKREIVKKERKLRTPQPVQEPEPVIEEPRVTPVREKTLTPEPSRTTTPASREISFVFVKEPSLPELPPIEVPALPELLPVPKSEVKEVKKERKLIEVTPELPEPKKKLPPPPKLAPKIKVRSTGRKSKVAEAPVTTEELQQLSDPLDFLAKYCIINPDRLPFYERVFNGAMNSQTPRYSHDHHKALKLGMVQFPPAQLSDHELHMLRDLTVITHAQSPRREGMNVPEQYLEKLNYSLEFIKSKQDALQDHMHSLQCEKIHLMAEMAKSLDRDIARVDYKTKGKKKKKKKKKKSSDPDYDMLGSMSAAKHFQPTRASDITDEVIVSRMDEKMMKKVKKDPIVKQLTLKISRDIEKLKSYDQRVIQIEDEKDLVGLYCMDYFFNEETASAPPYAFRRQQSRLYQKLHPDPDVQMNLDEVPAALQQVNNKLLTDKEFQYIYFILDLPKREKINFRLFSIIAALSEKVTQMDPVIRKLLNKVDYNALDVKMEKSKELFELLQDESRLPSGRAPADILEVELAAGGLTPEHTHYVLSKFNREGKGFIDFLDFVTYVPLFIEIHKRIVGDPFNDTQDI